jgi:imidazolonepropionase-like amidohydrolase
MNREPSVALVGGRVLTPTTAGDFSSSFPATVVLDGQRIAHVGPGEPPSGAAVVDVSGLTLLPGLVDLHTHVPTPSAMALYVQQGITAVRFAGTALGVVAGLRARVASGELPGPRIFSCGPLLDEPPAAWPDVSLEVSGPPATRAAVERVLDAEADALILAQRVRPETLAAIVQVADERGVPVTGQTWTTSVREAVLRGMHGVENTARLPEDPAADGAWVQGYRSIGHRLARLAWLWRTAPAEPLDEVLALMVERQTDWAPELCSFAYWAGLADGSLAALPGYALLDEAIRTAVPAARARTTEGWGDEDRDNTRAAIARMQQAIARYVALGGRLAVGTDAHPSGLFYHLELDLLRAAGLSSAAVLGAATAGGARALRRQADLGRVEAGALADLIAVEGDPLHDLAALQRVRHVFVDGRHVLREGTLVLPASPSH